MVCEASNVRSGKATRAFFLDSENGAARLLEGMELLNRSDLVVVFHRGSFPHEVKNKLERTSCSIEWVKCVDPGVKNSMDVQIIAELALRLATGQFEDAYILSEDKGLSSCDPLLAANAAGKRMRYCARQKRDARCLAICPLQFDRPQESEKC
ncbi:hypothetical protein [Eggerthella guodeyinii]|uniref:hypothetical protein n=1 Tax=Eggerthella guodeyinii TaxID=2690837 RepID=UPI0018A1FC17|nr:hypothetical protein [Eggerthella guodeyinii]